MKKQLKITLLITISSVLSGCNSNTASHALSNAVDKALVATSGNKPASRFHFTGPEYINRWYFSNKNYKMNAPTTYQKDWIKMNGWQGVEDFQGTELVLYFKDVLEYGDLFSYGINVFSSVGEYGEMQKAIESKDIEYIRSHIRIDTNDKLRIEYLGKEDYICKVMEYTKKNYKSSKYIGYTCYKFNPSHTKYKSVNIKLTYTKSPNLPAKYKQLAKEYTYQDLKNRAQRMLDSLYIKDGW